METSKFVSPIAVAPHGTGGAVDLTLCRSYGAETDMGTVIDATPRGQRRRVLAAAQNRQEADHCTGIEQHFYQQR